jgi:hypothetical protein
MPSNLTQELYFNLLGLLKYLLICPLAGFIMTVCLLKTLEALQIFPIAWKTTTLKTKTQCWVYLSILAAVIALLVRSFSYSM